FFADRSAGRGWGPQPRAGRANLAATPLPYNQESRMPRLALMLAGLALALPLGAQAQCPQPDALDGGPCCSPAQEKLPAFPKFALPSLSICWRDCAVDKVSGVIASFTPPIPGPAVAGAVPPCGLFR